MIDTTELETTLAGFADERDWTQFHTPKNLVMALVGEVGELCELLQWRTEDDIAQAIATPAFEGAVADELADVLIYLVRLASILGVDVDKAVTQKIGKNAARYPADGVRGSIEKRP